MKIYNFSAGPAMLPEEVMLQAQEEFVSWNNTGVSMMEMPHRSEEFKNIAAESIQDMRDLLDIPDNYQVLFLHGGGRSQFAMIPMNLLGNYERAAYVNFGLWGHLAIEEARKYCEVSVVADNNPGSRTCVPSQSSWDDFSDHAYLYTVDNETVNGLEFNYTPHTGDVPLVSDMSSNLLSRPFDIKSYGLVFACAQKNLGPSGVTVVIVRDDLLNRGMLPGTPSMFNYKVHAENHSMYNTSPTYSWYVVGLVLKWIKRQGGLEAMGLQNQRKSKKLYDYIDSEDFYINDIPKDSRSRMNVVFNLVDDNLNADFLQQAKQAGLVNLKGHRLVKGMRASIYNAMPEEGIDALIDFMSQFVRSKG